MELKYLKNVEKIKKKNNKKNYIKKSEKITLIYVFFYDINVIS